MFTSLANQIAVSIWAREIQILYSGERLAGAYLLALLQTFDEFRRSLLQNGTNQANCTKIYWRQSPTKTTGHQSRPKERTSYWWSQETTSLQTWYCCPSWNQKIPEIHWIAHPKIAIPKIGSWNRSRFQDWLAIPVYCCRSFTRSLRSLLGWSFRGHQSLRHPRKEGHHHAKGHPIGTKNPRRTCLSFSWKTTKRPFSWPHIIKKHEAKLILQYL